MVDDPDQGSGPAGARRAPISHDIASAVSAAFVLGAVGPLGLWAHEPWLFPSLGPTIVLQHASPHRGAGSLRNTLIGHAIGAAAGFFAVAITGAIHVPPEIGTGVLSAPRVAATALAIALTIFGQALAKADHPPAAATTMLISLGGFSATWHSVGILAIGVGITATLGHFARGWHRRRRDVESEN